MTPIDCLIQADRETKKRICIVGCSMRDLYVHGDLQPSQDGVMKFVERRQVESPGGAAGAARQLIHWHCDTALISLVKKGPGEAWNQVPAGYTLECRRMPTKVRYIDQSGRIVFRHDLDNGYGLDANGMQQARELALKAVCGCHWDAVLISDYQKGFVDEAMIRGVIDHCNRRGVPVVADAKMAPHVYRGAIIKGNADYAVRYEEELKDHNRAVIITRGSELPATNIEYIRSWNWGMSQQTVVLKSHVGAGDCFSAHLTLALAHGFPLDEAICIAHSGGRIYVQHEHGRPAFPFELRKDLDPVGGKIVLCSDLPALRRSIPGRIVVANGVFRLPHAGHAWLLDRARQQGDALVVALNSDSSAGHLRLGKLVLLFAERARILGSMTAVDWIVGFDELDPCAIIRALKPDVLAKGPEYIGHQVPGHDLVATVWFAPESPFPRHASDL
jgi:D-beta-D-heptose 7-phosphate kinase/D-beta-D-heptose 1-phosphate adenosyltransferase